MAALAGVVLCLASQAMGLRSSGKGTGLVYGDGKGPGSSSAPGMFATAFEFPAQPACQLGTGFGLFRRCQYPSAFESIPSCMNAPVGAACVEISRAESLQGYTRDVRSTSDYTSLSSTVVRAEIGGFGVKVSAGFEYLKASRVTEESLAFFIGLNGRTEHHSIENVVNLKLTAAAKSYLESNPQGFVERYGLRYIHGESFGGSFLGSVTLNARATSDASDVQAFAAFSVNKGFFSAAGSAEYQNFKTSANFRVDETSNANWVGGSDVNASFGTPELLMNAYQEWQGSFRSHPAPLTVTTRNWIDSEEVQAIVNSMSVADQALFNAPAISNAILKEIGGEDAKVALVHNSVLEALEWDELKNACGAKGKSCLEELHADIVRAQVEIDTLLEPEIVIIQEQFLAGNDSWFRADSFLDRYKQCVQKPICSWVKGENGQHCNAVCGALGRVCNSWRQSALTTNASVAQAFAEAGYICNTFGGKRDYPGSPFSHGISAPDFDCVPFPPDSSTQSSCTENIYAWHAPLCGCDLLI